MLTYISLHTLNVFFYLPVNVFVKLTAFHQGFHEFRLCANDVPQVGTDSSIAVTQDCFDRHPLASPTGETR